MITVTAFTSCSQRLLTCSADMAMAAAASPRHRPPTGERKGRPARGARATPRRLCAYAVGEGAGGESARAEHRLGDPPLPPRELQLPAWPAWGTTAPGRWWGGAGRSTLPGGRSVSRW